MSIRRHKYDIGMKFYNYEILGIKNYKSAGRTYSKYVLKCLKCGGTVERHSSEVAKNIKCPHCKQNMEYYRYNVGDIVNGLEIVEKQRQQRSNGQIQRAYLCKCVIDGYTSIHSEDNLLKGKGCPVCAGIVVMRGINDINTVAPWLGDLLENREDGYLYGVGAHKKVKFKCPYCGTITKPIAIYNIYTSKHISCRKCGDGISMPEKIMYGMLEYLKVDFSYQKSFDWSCGKLYDFYIPSMNMIIETHGLQHYRDTNGAWDDLNIVRQNDQFKKDIAIANNIDLYVVINCSNTSPLLLIEECKQSLSQYFNFDDLDVGYIIFTSLRSFCIKAGDMWNAGNHDVHSIANLLRIADGTVRRYLKTLTQIGYLNISYPIK